MEEKNKNRIHLNINTRSLADNFSCDNNTLSSEMKNTEL